jgi:hypothetical protein
MRGSFHSYEKDFLQNTQTVQVLEVLVFFQLKRFLATVVEILHSNLRCKDRFSFV